MKGFTDALRLELKHDDVPVSPGAFIGVAERAGLAPLALLARALPASGGDTSFANMYRALETLPEDVLERIDGLSIKNDATYDSSGSIRRGFEPNGISMMVLNSCGISSPGFTSCHG